MFTGIVKAIGTIQHIDKSSNRLLRCIVDPGMKKKFSIGESVSIAGVCSTITQKQKSTFVVEYMPQTVQITTVRSWKKGTKVNIEPSLKVDEELSGHFVYGHIDGVATITKIQKREGQYAFTCTTPASIKKYIAPKGSIALDGVSLTIGRKTPASITVFLTPFTFFHTTFQYSKVGDMVNIEADALAKLLLQGTRSKRKNQL